VVVGNRPRRFLLTPDRKEVWVSAELAGEVHVIDRASNTVSAVIPFAPPGMRKTDVTPVGMAIAQDGKTAFVTLGRANHIAVVDGPTKKVSAYVLVGSRPWGVALSADGKILYVANGLSDDLSIVDVASRKVLRSVPVGRVPHSVATDD
jgi:YVTN family beta-propeller protein